MKDRFKGIWVAIETQTLNDFSRLRGVGGELQALGFQVSFHPGRIGNMSVREWMLEYRPDVLVLRGAIWGERYFGYFKVNGGQDYQPLIVVIPSEFTYSLLPADIHDQLFDPPKAKVGEFVDLVLCIHEKEKKWVTSTWPTIKETSVIPIGLPAFDRFYQKHLSKIDARKEFGIRECELKKYIVLVGSRSANSDFQIGSEGPEIQRVLKRANYFFGCRPEHKKQVIEFHSKLSLCFISATKRLAKSCPEVIICFKPHPAEKQEKYDIAFSGIENIRVIKSNAFSMTDLIWIADLFVGYRCGSFLEARLAEVPIVHFMPEIVSTSGAKYELAEAGHFSAFDNVARWTVRNERELVDLCGKYFADGELAINTYCTELTAEGLRLEEMTGALDGESSERAAKEIAKLVRGSDCLMGNQSKERIKDRAFVAKATNRAYLDGYFQPFRITKHPYSTLRYLIRGQLKRLVGFGRQSLGARSQDSTIRVDIKKEMVSYRASLNRENSQKKC